MTKGTGLPMGFFDCGGLWTNILPPADCWAGGSSFLRFLSETEHILCSYPLGTHGTNGKPITRLIIFTFLTFLLIRILLLGVELPLHTPSAPLCCDGTFDFRQCLQQKYNQVLLPACLTEQHPYPLDCDELPA